MSRSAPSETNGAPATRHKHHRARFFLGVFLMGSSFIVYPGYVMIALLSVPISVMAAIAVAASLASWTLFFIGTTLAGPAGWRYLKAVFTTPIEKLPPEPPADEV